MKSFNKKMQGYKGRDYQPYLTTTWQWSGFEHVRLRCKSVIETFTLPVGSEARSWRVKFK